MKEVCTSAPLPIGRCDKSYTHKSIYMMCKNVVFPCSFAQALYSRHFKEEGLTDKTYFGNSDFP
jgi:hypothetical protein